MPAHRTPVTPPSPPPASDAEVAAVIARYAPSCLPEHRWAQCSDAVRAAVTAANPSTGKIARLWLVHLCQFLSTACGWAGDGPPDLVAMLTESTIAAYTYTGAKRASRVSGIIRRTSLRHIARAAGAVAPVARPYAKTTTTALRPELLAAARQPLPLAAIAQGWELSRGRALPQEVFRPVIAVLLTSCGNTAARPGWGTFTSPPSVRVLAEATDQSVKEGAASMKKPSTPPPPKAAKKMSRRAVLRFARANLAAGEAHRAGPTLADAPAPGALPEEVTAAVEAYLPLRCHRGSWAQIADLTCRLTLGYAPPSPGNAASVASHVAAFLRWFRAWPGRADTNAPLDARELLATGLVDIYLTVVSGSVGSRSTQRAVLRRALRSLDGSARPAKLAHQPVSAPYTPAQCAGFVALARHQPTLGRKRNMAFLVGLGLGAGLDGRDLKSVTRGDVANVALDAATTVLMVTVTGGQRPRTVPVRAGYDALVREGLELHDRGGRGQHAPLLGQDTTRDHVTSPVTERAVHADVTRAVDIEASRLRNTWLVAAMCAALPMADLLRAAGLRSARTIGDLLPYCPDADPSVIAAVLATMADAATAGGKS